MNGFNITGAGTNQLRWGGTTTQFRSGYGFVPTPVIFPIQLGQAFDVGTFTHMNRVIPVGAGITAVTFNGSINLNINGIQVNGLGFTYNFLHDETVNVASDLITIPNNGAIADVFTAGGNSYVLTILGFKQNGNLISSLTTPENQNNTAILQAILTQTPVHAPEPSTYLLLSSVLSICYFIKRKQKVNDVKI